MLMLFMFSFIPILSDYKLTMSATELMLNSLGSIPCEACMLKAQSLLIATDSEKLLLTHTNLLPRGSRVQSHLLLRSLYQCYLAPSCNRFAPGQHCKQSQHFLKAFRSCLSFSLPSRQLVKLKQNHPFLLSILHQLSFHRFV